MALEDIDNLIEKEQGSSGHTDDHKKIVRGLKSVKNNIFGRVSDNTISIMGDSIGANNKYSTGTPGTSGYVSSYDGDKGFLNWTLAFLNGRMTMKANVAVSGTRTDQWISSGQHTSIVASGTNWCVITPPTNDREQGISLSATQDNYLTIINSLRLAGIKVILMGLLPESAGSVGTAFTQTKINYTLNYNYWIKTIATTNPNILAVDPFRALADLDGGGWFGFANPNIWTPDGLHPHAWGTARIGKILADALDPLVPYLDIKPVSSIDKPNAGIINGNILLGAGMHGTAGNNGSDKGGTGTVVNNFGARSSDGTNFAGTVVSSIVASTDMDRCPWQQHVITGAVTKLRGQQATITPASGLYVPGTTIARPQVEIDMDTDITNLTKLVLSLSCNLSSGGAAESQWAFFNTNGFPMENRFTKDLRGRYPVLVGPPMLIPANTSSVTWYLDFQGMGTFRWRNPALRTTPLF